MTANIARAQISGEMNAAQTKNSLSGAVCLPADQPIQTALGVRCCIINCWPGGGNPASGHRAPVDRQTGGHREQ